MSVFASFPLDQDVFRTPEQPDAWVDVARDVVGGDTVRLSVAVSDDVAVDARLYLTPEAATALAAALTQAVNEGRKVTHHDRERLLGRDPGRVSHVADSAAGSEVGRPPAADPARRVGGEQLAAVIPGDDLDPGGAVDRMIQQLEDWRDRWRAGDLP